ncbi:LysR family transcriptional regulator [Dyella japonica]|uniref:LysR family transcriptional regulator n=1 Tax=Dyella japonica A8 TaxID=1217721 RepID=A0A075K605_9GAMM|nr:LysR family transcriptional regulator [Dyella japonica]AIF47603.1 LysR family transcriptional regulator [Dyella japonica A8]
MRDLNDLYYFAQVVEHQGFAPASRVLLIPKSKLSRRVAMLEERLGVQLIQRSSRHFSVTDIGQEFYRHCQAMLVEAEAADEAIAYRRAEPQGVVRLTCPTGLLHARVSDILADYLTKYPKVKLQLEATNRRVDVIAEGIDVAIRARPPPLEDSDLVMRIFAERSWKLVASPSLVASLRAPDVPADLSCFPTIDLSPSNGIHVWELTGPKGVKASIHHDPRMVTDDMLALLAAAAKGVGIVQLPSMVVSGALKNGSVVELLPAWTPKVGVVHAVFSSRRGLLPSVRHLIDFLAERLAVDEDEASPATPATPASDA